MKVLIETITNRKGYIGVIFFIIGFEHNFLLVLLNSFREFPSQKYLSGAIC